MLIIGAKGLAFQLLGSFQESEFNSLSFYDDLNKEIGEHLFNKFPILKSKSEAKVFFKRVNNQFTIGISGNKLREKLSLAFIELGGKFSNTISKNANISPFIKNLGIGNNVLQGVIIEPGVTIGNGNLINIKSSICHDVSIGDFCEICPGAILTGNVTIGSYTFVGSGAIILPGISIGHNCVIGAGAIVTKNIPENTKVKGVPAK